ncbi:MAG: ester cyclase [Eubacteriales bacterium]|nr:ester cyclase [Synergistaceae bacterium]MDD3537903.1 ester cyclase [Eubacteriales bacterium]NCB17982.1 hypothetical protein [Synergistales bacterium]MDD3391296.1 ester cyclase [Synergistaceae bacterium]MDD4022370.1 ester cyclase [Synergistaceae bacterium]
MDSKALVKEFYEQVASNNRGDEVEHYVHPDCTLRAGEENIPIGLEGMREHLADVRQTYPDFRIRVVRQHEDKDFVISEVIMEGTHGGEWLGISPTGKKIRITAVNIDRIAGGRIIEHGGAANTFETFRAEGFIRAAE